MIESNPGAGTGVLLAYMFFSKDKKTKDSAPGALIIHLLVEYMKFISRMYL